MTSRGEPFRLSTRQPARDSWRVEVVEEKTDSGLVLFEYAIREARGEPFLLNNHRAQLRETHQRVLTGPNGGLMHVSGVEVVDLEGFRSDARFHRWVDKASDGRWRDDQGRMLVPFRFQTAAWAGARDEFLDPQWQRETYTLPIAQQVNDAIERYSDRAQRGGWVGDRRGTTLNLQVGALTDDAGQSGSDFVDADGGTILTDDTDEHGGVRFQNVTVPNAATITNAIFSLVVVNDTNDEPLHRLRGQAADTTAAFVEGTNNNIDARTRTSAAVDWNVADLGVPSGNTSFNQWGAATAGGAGASVASIIAEITVRAGWVSGNSLVLIWEQSSSNSARDLSVTTYDGNTARAAKLDIDYSAGGGTNRRRRFLTGAAS